MTDAQLAVLAKASPEIAMAKFKEYIDLAREAEAAIVRLPHTNERGDSVVHGCNQEHAIFLSYEAVTASDKTHTLPTHDALDEARRYEIEKF